MIFDIGANSGHWALQNMHMNEKIICVEPDQVTFSTLKQNTQDYQLIECINYAVCNNCNNDITFYKCACDVLSTLNINWLTSPQSRFFNAPFTPIICKTITIDKMISIYGIPNLIKIDVEGGEYECISSLTQKVEVLCFEWASEMNDISFKCLDHLHALGFVEFHVQYEDKYTYRPSSSQYTSIIHVKAELSRTTPKEHWGMIWCK